ncbi:MAG: YceI family protein [Acidobacteriota bacterium]
MNKTLRRTLIALIAVSLLAIGTTLPASAEVSTHTIDASHSEVGFEVRHLLSKARGRFDDFSGTIVVNQKEPSASSVEFTILAGSIDTNNEDRDQHLRSDDFFAVEEHPEIHFVSKRVQKVSDGQYRVTGTLSMRGVSKDITLPVEFLGTIDDPWGNTKGGFRTETVIDRKDFGIVWNKALDQGGAILGDEVEIEIELETQLVKEKS